MNIENIETALKERIPFEITTAAGDKFRVDDEFQVAPPRWAAERIMKHYHCTSARFRDSA